MKSKLITFLLIFIVFSLYSQSNKNSTTQNETKKENTLLNSSYPVKINFCHNTSLDVDFRIYNKNNDSIVKELYFYNVICVDTTIYLEEGSYYIGGTVIPEHFFYITNSIGNWVFPVWEYHLYFDVYINNGINNYLNDNILVYPNPANNIIFIKGSEYIDEIDILSLNGNVLKNNLRLNSNSGIDISYLKNGIYFIRMKDKNNIGIYKFIKN